ncbi:glycosyltransferase family 2 protein [Candidatus Woesearchaeota archaeon]|nr:glycosyltransferase family 2 protein [Candidatus Woesearchaeota archaeon]
MQDDQDFWVIIPAYREGERIRRVLQKVKLYARHIVVVDDGSSDDTYAQAAVPGVIRLRHKVNLGKGNALKTGCDYAVREGATLMVVMDADGQHDPTEIPRFLAALNGNDVVFGSRKRTEDMPAVLQFGNWFLSSMTAWLYGVSLHDTQSGYRAFTASAYSKIRWESSGYSLESEMIMRTGREKLTYKEIFIKTIYADRYKGTTIVHGMKIMLDMLKWKFLRGI